MYLTESIDNNLVNVTVSCNYNDTQGCIYLNDFQDFSSLFMVSCILWGNRQPHIKIIKGEGEDSSFVSIGWSNLEQGEVDVLIDGSGKVEWLEGNISEDPVFVDPWSGTYPIDANSPCVDAGRSTVVFDGETEIYVPENWDGEAPDIGAYQVGVHSAGKVSPAVPGSFFILRSYPNPFNSSTRLCFNLQENSLMILRIYDLPGREVATLLDHRLTSGFHSVAWDGSGMQSGSYFATLYDGRSIETVKLILVK